MELDLISLIGLVLLIGIVKKNAIMMVDFALEAERVQGMTPLAAIREACVLRFRPIMMTTMAALLGARAAWRSVPAPGPNCGGRWVWRSWAGLLLSQVLTLYTTPVIYLGFDALQRPLTRRRAVAAPPDAV